MSDNKIDAVRRNMADTLAALERLEEIGDALPGGEDSRIGAIRAERLEEITGLERALHASRGELENARKSWAREKEKLEGRVHEFKKALASDSGRRTRNSELENRLQAWKEELEAARTAWQEEKGREAERIEADREAFRREKRRQLDEIEEIRRASPGWQGIKAGLEADLGETEEQLAQSLRQLESLGHEITDAHGRFDNAQSAWESEKRTILKEIEELSADRKILKRTNTELYERMKGAEERLASKIGFESKFIQEKAALEAQLRREKTTRRDVQAQQKVRAQQILAQEKQALQDRLNREKQALQARLDAQMRALTAELEQYRKSFTALRGDQAQQRALQDRLDAQKRALAAELQQSRKSFTEANEKVARLKAQLEKLLKETASKGPEDLTSGDPLSAGIPTVDPLLEPAWEKILEALHRPIITAYAHLRRLAAARLPAGHRALLRLAAGEIVEAQDHMKILRQFFEAGGETPENAPIQQTLESALMTWEGTLRRRRVAVSRVINPGLPNVLHHAETLRIAFYQLLRNAYEAMPRGGTLTISAKREENTGDVIITFRDSGPGFSPEALAGLFIPFATARRGHLGIGLALVRRTLRALGGDAEAANAKTGGAVVTLRLPAGRDELPSLSEEPPLPNPG